MVDFGVYRASSKWGLIYFGQNDHFRGFWPGFGTPRTRVFQCPHMPSTHLVWQTKCCKMVEKWSPEDHKKYAISRFRRSGHLWHWCTRLCTWDQRAGFTYVWKTATLVEKSWKNVFQQNSLCWVGSIFGCLEDPMDPRNGFGQIFDRMSIFACIIAFVHNCAHLCTLTAHGISYCGAKVCRLRKTLLRTFGSHEMRAEQKWNLFETFVKNAKNACFLSFSSVRFCVFFMCHMCLQPSSWV